MIDKDFYDEMLIKYKKLNKEESNNQINSKNSLKQNLYLSENLLYNKLSSNNDIKNFPKKRVAKFSTQALEYKKEKNELISKNNKKYKNSDILISNCFSHQPSKKSLKLSEIDKNKNTNNIMSEINFASLQNHRSYKDKIAKLRFSKSAKSEYSILSKNSNNISPFIRNKNVLYKDSCENIIFDNIKYNHIQTPEYSPQKNRNNKRSSFDSFTKSKEMYF